MIIFTNVHIQASLSRFVIVTQVMSSQNKGGEVRTGSPVPISSAVNVERPAQVRSSQNKGGEVRTESPVPISSTLDGCNKS